VLNTQSLIVIGITNVMFNEFSELFSAMHKYKKKSIMYGDKTWKNMQN